jgi:phosphopantothenoylcysteine decarboxylase/phosphopantothenate--cysteine ligase
MRVLLGVCGGIAAYKACALVSELVQRGDEVDVIMTEEAQRFVTSLTFSALTRRHVATTLWDEHESIAHIDLVRRADVFAIVPATAQTIAKLALGLADDLLSNAALAAKIPIVIAPAMNSAMYEHSATQAHLATLRSRGVRIIEPGNGFLAEREIGIGRLAAQDIIVAGIDAAHQPEVQISAKHVLITAGPTREAIDPVRFLSNPSTGKTGIELARIARDRGAAVTLILGPTDLAVPPGVDVIHVITAAEMYAAAMAEALTARPDLVIATAAVADHRPRAYSPYKLKKGRDHVEQLDLVPTEDIVAALRASLPDAFVVGFAAETDDHAENAARKLQTKNLDAIVMNDVSEGRAFGSVENTCTVYFADGDHVQIGPQQKNQLARQLLDVLEQHAE